MLISKGLEGRLLAMRAQALGKAGAGARRDRGKGGLGEGGGRRGLWHGEGRGFISRDSSLNLLLLLAKGSASRARQPKRIHKHRASY